jgi:hypothetical protein
MTWIEIEQEGHKYKPKNFTVPSINKSSKGKKIEKPFSTHFRRPGDKISKEEKLQKEQRAQMFKDFKRLIDS